MRSHSEGVAMGREFREPFEESHNLRLGREGQTPKLMKKEQPERPVRGVKKLHSHWQGWSFSHSTNVYM